MKSLVTLLLTLMMLISPFAIQASDSAEQTTDSTRFADTESPKAESASADDGTSDGKIKEENAEEEEEPDCD